MNPIIIDEEKYQNTRITNLVGIIEVWNDDKEKYESYVFRKTYRKPTSIQEITKYLGSSKGNNKANPKLLDAMRKSSKPHQYRIIVHNTDKESLGFFEQREVMKINFPDGGHKSEDCFNEKFPTDSATKEEDVRSHVALIRLVEKIRKHLDSSDDFSFDGDFTSRERIKYLKDNGFFIQCRDRISGQDTSIDKYKEDMLRNPNPEDWKGKLFLLMPNNPEEDERILDGNQSGDACLRASNMPGLYDIRVPYEDYEHISETDLMKIGLELNKEARDRPAGNSPEDIERIIKNTIIELQLFTKSRKPIMNHPLVVSIYKDLNKSDGEIKRILSSVKKFFEEQEYEELRIQAGVYDFRESALKKEEGDNANRKKWNELFKDFKEDEYDNVHQFTAGLEEKISKNITSYKKREGKWPKRQLSRCVFRLENDYNKAVKNDYQFYKDVIFSHCAVCDITIILVNPTGENYTLISLNSKTP